MAKIGLLSKAKKIINEKENILKSKQLRDLYQKPDFKNSTRSLGYKH